LDGLFGCCAAVQAKYWISHKAEDGEAENRDEACRDGECLILRHVLLLTDAEEDGNGESLAYQVA